MGASDYLKARGVVDLIHFTPVRNLAGILAEGIVPRDVLERDGKEFVCYDQKRLDGKRHVNLSITHPNISLFFKFRKEASERTTDATDHVFAVLTLDPSLLDAYADSVMYRATNAASITAMDCSVQELFGGARTTQRDNETTDNQAEVLVATTIDPKYIKTIEFPVDGEEPTEEVRSLYEGTKRLVAHHGLKAELRIHDERFRWDARIAGRGRDEVHRAYFESWKGGFEQYEALSRALSEFKWTTKFDTIAVPRTEVEASSGDPDRVTPNVARWQLDYYRPKQQEKRSNEALSAIAVIEKIILRGRITTVSTSLEQSIPSNQIQLAHQIQASIVEMVKHQAIVPGLKLFVDVEADCRNTAQRAIADLKELSSNVCRMYRCQDLLDGIAHAKNSNEADLTISLRASSEESDQAIAVITETPHSNEAVNFDFTRVQAPVSIDPQKDVLEYLLNYIFGFPRFNENQIDGVIRGLTRQDSIVLLPTGSGKSVVFQLLSLITPGIAIVVCPIISLIEDQVLNLCSRGIDRVVGISSNMDQDAKNSAIEGVTRGQFFINYVSPERFQNRAFLDSIEYYAKTNIISAVAIDEAHCVSEWGHDFRTAYLGLAQTCRRVCSTGSATPPLLALTGTASASVLRDMQHDLGIIGEDAVIQPTSFDRPEIMYRVFSVPSDKKQAMLEEIIKTELPSVFNESPDTFYRSSRGEETKCGIVFCPNVNGSYGLMASSDRALASGHPGVADFLQRILPGKVGMYSGSPPKMFAGDWRTEKRLFAHKFKSNELPVMVCTKAFGMGIDKPNVRWIVHYGISGSLESYYQEAGRAARDKRTAYAYIILSDDFPELNRQILNPSETSVEAIDVVEKSKGDWKGDDVSRSLFFHTSSFDGIAAEIQRVKDVLDQCNPGTWRNQRFHVPFAGSRKTEIEKAVYRLQLLGFFRGYSVDYRAYGSGTFVIEANKFDRDEIIENYIDYIRAYQDNDDYAEQAKRALTDAVKGLDGRDFIIKVVETLLKEFTYKVVEEGRRRAIAKMLDTAKAAAACSSRGEADAEFRRRLLAYLHTDKSDAKKSARLQDVINNATDVRLLNRVIKASSTQAKRDNLLGEADRLLEAYPQHYGLHFIQASAYMSAGEYSKMVDAIASAAKFGAQSYGLDELRIQHDMVSILNSEAARVIDAETWNRIVPRISKVLSLSVRDLYAVLNAEQALIAGKVNLMYELAEAVTERRSKRGNR